MALSPQVDASDVILRGTSICHTPLGWESHHRSLLSGNCWSPGERQAGGKKVLPGALGTQGLEEPPGRSMTQLSQQVGTPVGAMGVGVPGSLQPSTAAPDGSSATALASI